MAVTSRWETQANIVSVLWHGAPAEERIMTMKSLVVATVMNILLAVQGVSAEPDPAHGDANVTGGLAPHASRDPQAIEKALPLLRQLDSEVMQQREEATQKLIAMGALAIPALKDALGRAESPEVRTRVEYILDEIDWPASGVEMDNLQLSLKSSQSVYEEGANVRLRVRLAHSGKQEKKLTLVSDGLVGISPDCFRTIMEGPDGPVSIGFFANLNRGPDKVSLSIPPQSTKCVSFTSYLGRRSGKGGDEEPLPPGKYKLAVILGDDFEAWNLERPTQVRSNWIEIEITPRK